MKKRIREFIPAVVFLGVSISFWGLFSFLVDCPGMLKGPWTLDRMLALKKQEHLMYWICVLGIPFVTLVLLRFINNHHNKKENHSSEEDKLNPISNLSLWKKILFLIIIPLFIFLTAPRPSFHAEINKMEEGHRLSVADKFSKGEKAYRDISFIYGPGIEIIQSHLAFAVFEKSLAGLRKLLWFITPLGVLAGYFLVLILLKNKWLSLFYVYLVHYLFLIHHRMMFPLGALLLFVLGVRSKDKKKRQRFMIGSGVMCVLGYFYSMESGVLSFVAIGFSLLAWTVAQKEKLNPRDLIDKPLGQFLIGSIGLGVVFLLWFTVTGRIGFVIANTFEMPNLMLSAQGKPTPILCEPLLEFIKNPFILFSSSGVWVRWWIPVLVFIGYLTYTGHQIMRGHFQKNQAVALGLILSGLLFFTIVLGRTDYDHWQKGTALYWVLLIVVLDHGWTAIRSRDIPKCIAGALLILLSTGIIFKSIPLFMGLYSFPKFELYPKETKESLPKELERVGHLKMSEEDKDEMQGVVSRIWTYANPDDYVYIFSVEPIYYFLADVTNPTRFAHTINVVGDKAVTDVIHRLDTKKPKLILLDNYPYEPQFEPYHKVIRQYIRTHYKEAERFGHYSFMVN